VQNEAVRILLVEDDLRVANAMLSALRRRGYEVQHAATAAAALAAGPCDLVLLDLTLPDRDGISLCRELRERSEHLGIIAVTARGEERDRVTGLRTGADDYVVKPFSMVELQARIDAVLRRTARAPERETAIEVGPLHIDVAARRVQVAGREVSLTRKEFDILLCLARQPGAAVPRDRILMDVWHTTWSGRHTVEVHVGSLRGKLGDHDLVQTVRGVGYRLRAG
jgi:DNA-binding response OmpR family regulator